MRFVALALLVVFAPPILLFLWSLLAAAGMED